jgi:hypothetical protein
MPPKPPPKMDTESGVTISRQFIIGLVLLIVGAIASVYVHHINSQGEGNEHKELYILSFGLLIVGFLFALVSQLRKREVRNGFTIIVTDLLNMPKTMKQLAWVQFFRGSRFLRCGFTRPNRLPDTFSAPKILPQNFTMTPPTGFLSCLPFTMALPPP